MRTAATGLAEPSDVLVDPHDGTLLVVESAAHRVVRIALPDQGSRVEGARLDGEQRAPRHLAAVALRGPARGLLGGLLGGWGKWMKHAKYIYNIQDFNPEQVLAVGYTKSKLITDRR